MSVQESIPGAEPIEAMLQEVPAALMVRMAEAVQQVSAPVDAHEPSSASGLRGLDPALLAEAGLACLQQALDAGEERRGAFALLTADALITAACEAAATGPLPDALSARRFAAGLGT